MSDKFIKQAEQTINVQVIKETAELLKDYVPSIAKMTNDMYKGFIDEGFTESQAFTFSKDYMLKLLFQNNN